MSLRFFCHDTRTDWKLQHSRALTFAQLRQQHGLTVGELKRIMTDIRLALVDLLELGHRGPELMRCGLSQLEGILQGTCS